MNLRTMLIASVLVSSAGAQPRKDFVSPEVHPDNTVTFRLHAPKASNVSLQGIGNPPEVAMEKDDDGVWSVTVGPLPPEIYDYTFAVDGATVLDLKNRQLSGGGHAWPVWRHYIAEFLPLVFSEE